MKNLLSVQYSRKDKIQIFGKDGLISSRNEMGANLTMIDPEVIRLKILILIGLNQLSDYNFKSLDKLSIFQNNSNFWVF